MVINALHVRGPFRGPTGYEHHVREFVREFHRQGVSVQLTDLPAWGPAKLPAHLRDPWFDSLDRPTDAHTVLHFCMPHQVEPQAGRANVNYTMFEATRIPAAWVVCQRRHDLVIVPTESSRLAWMTSGVPETNVRVCPLGINTSLFRGDVSPMRLRLDSGDQVEHYGARFLNVSELSPRKNVLGLLRVWLRATSRADHAVLMLKLGAYAPRAREEFQQQFEGLQKQLHRGLDDAAPVHFIDGLLSDADMPSLYAAATHYISLSHGEGWDQAMVEAAATGLGLIAPNHSAYTAYLDESTARLVTSRLVPAGWVGGASRPVLFQGAEWWEPDQEHAIAHVRSVIAGDPGPRSPRQRILRELTWEHATLRLLAILEEVELKRGRHWWRLPRLYMHR
jgi:glycosyltransferase involved in cell wall biosynthesis